MTINQAINEVDNLKPNMYGIPVKIKWLSRLDRRIFEEILLTHELRKKEKEPFLPTEEEEERERPEEDFAPWALDRHGRRHRRPAEKLVFTEYTENDLDKELIVREPYDEIYIFWLSAQIDQNNMEYLSFNNSNAMFESVYTSFRNAFNRTHMPKGKRKIYY